jgi:hypothetical protein
VLENNVCLLSSSRVGIVQLLLMKGGVEAYGVGALKGAPEHAAVGGGDAEVLVEEGAEEGEVFFFLGLGIGGAHGADA